MLRAGSSSHFEGTTKMTGEESAGKPLTSPENVFFNIEGKYTHIALSF